MKPFLEAVRDRILMGDGSIAAELYARGVFVNRCFDEITLSDERLVWDIYEAFVKAGAEVLTTNTFGANRPKLTAAGFAAKLADINRRGVEVCRSLLGDRGYVLGAVGPLWRERVAPRGGLSEADAREIFDEQIGALAAAGADAISLEGFYDLAEIRVAVAAAKAAGKPAVAHMAFESLGLADTDAGADPVATARALVEAGADVVGVFNGGGPQRTLEILTKIHEALPDLPLSAKPAPGLPEVQEGHQIVMATPEFMAEMARRYALKGARIVAGGDGVTPAMVRDMADFVMTISPRQRIEVISEPAPEAPRLPRIPLAEKGEWGRILASGEWAVSVELDPPPGLDPSKSIEGAVFLKQEGIQMINIADGPRAMARMGPRTMAHFVRDATGITPITHYCCRDRNILAMQMDLIGAHAEGFTNLMLITGDPPKMGNAAHATAVFDFDSVSLIKFVDQLNQGLDIGGRPLGGQTAHVLGTGCNPGAIDLDREVKHFENKVRAGAEFAFSQPVYDPELIETFLKRTDYIEPKIPFFVGILPLASLKNAEFLTNHVPGMEVPEEVRGRLRKAGSRDAERAEGIVIAQEALRHAKSFDRVRGAYIFPPFGNYRAVLKVLEGV